MNLKKRKDETFYDISCPDTRHVEHTGKGKVATHPE